MESKRVKAALVFCVLFVLWIVAKPFLSEVDPVIVKNTKEEIRRETGVRELLPPEDRISISQLPDGVFGYASPSRLEEIGHIDFVPLGRDSGKATGEQKVEIHKTSEGKIVVALYISQGDVALLGDPGRKMPLLVDACLKEHGKCDRLIGLPFSRLITWHSKSEKEKDNGAGLIEIRVR